MVIFRADPELNEVALIFDDGPNPKITPKLLEVLKGKQVQANFFLIGARAEEYPEVVKQIAESGHEIGNHTYTHKRLTQVLKEKGEAAVKEEIEKGAAAIKEAASLADLDVRFLRPPYLDWDEEVAKIAYSLYGERIVMSGLTIGDYDWGIDHRWDEDDKDAVTAQSERIIKAWSGADSGTLLAFHDSSQHNLPGNEYYKTWMNRALPTLEAIPRIIDDLRRKGLAIKKLSEMRLLSETKTILEVELAVPEDAEVICSIRDEAWIAAYPSAKLGLTAKDVRINAQGLNGEFVPKRIKWFKEKIAERSENWVAYVGKIDGVVKGFVVVSKDDAGRRFINSVYVKPGFQNHGLGTKLMRKAMAWLGSDKDIYLEVASHNDYAIHFYEHLGFEKTESVVGNDPDRPGYIKPIPQTEMVLRAAST